MKKFLIALMFVLMLVPAALAESVNFQTGLHVAKMNVNVRVLPKMWSRRIDHLLKGQTVNVKRVVSGWCDIELKKFKHAYVNCSLLEAASGNAGSAVVQAEEGTSNKDYNGVKVSRNADGNWALGAKDAKVMIEEFGDMQCPFCGSYFTDTFSKIFTDYISTGKVKYVFYNFPLSFHLESRNAAMAALCAGDQDKYWQMHAMILDKQSEWSTKDYDSKPFDGYAKSIGLNMDTFDSCMSTSKFSSQIDKDIAVADKKSVNGTPTFYVNGKVLEGAQPYEVFSAEIDSALNGK
jgi:protein-disulfide isomerase